MKTVTDEEERAADFGIVHRAAGSVRAFDRWSKFIVEASLSSSETVTVIPGLFNIIHSNNAGVAFGLFSENQTQMRTLALVGLSVVAVLLPAPCCCGEIEQLDGRSAAGLALILGGALGNVYDRVDAPEPLRISSISTCAITTGTHLILPIPPSA